MDLIHVRDARGGGMIGYVALGTNDLPKAAKFYDAILAELGARRFIETERWISWGNPGGAGIMVTKPYDGRAASVGNGVMVALAARERAHVDRIHQLAMALGAQDEGPPGPRGERFYAGYFRDLDGNKLSAFVMG